jgi:hypothetical protein
MATTTIEDILGNTVAFRGASGVGATGVQGASGIGGATGITGASGPRGATGATGIVAPWTKITSTTTLSANAQYIIDTSGGSFQVTLPASPTVGNVVVIQDGANWTTYPLTVLQNGSTIEGQSTNLVLNVGGVLVYLLYDGTTWQVSATVGAAGASGVQGASGFSAGSTGAQGASGAAGPAGATGPGATGALTQGYVNDIPAPAFLNDISTQFDGRNSAFDLYTDTTAVTSLAASVNLQVVVNGLMYKPYIKEITYPWITEVNNYGFRSFRLALAGATGVQQVVFSTPPKSGSDSVLMVINNNSNVQTKKYPYSAMTIALGD